MRIRRRSKEWAALGVSLLALGCTSTNEAASRSAEPATKVNCSVLAVDRGNGLVTLSAGGKDGVGIGQVFVIRRGDGSVGKVEVVKVYDDTSACKILEEAAAPLVKEGDDVSTRLYY